MEDLLKTLRPELQRHIETHINELARELAGVSPWVADLQDVLLPYVCRGKMIRGALVGVGLQLFQGSPSSQEHEATLQIGAAMELLQSLLLIHDDIMDQDDFRRGHPSVHRQYRFIGEERGVKNHKRMSESLAICMGDVAGFASFGLIAKLDLPAKTLQGITKVMSRELALVGLAQMQDVYHGHMQEEAREDAILDLYRYKTGRYTFSMPLILGGIVAGVPEGTQKILGDLGEVLGMIFQIKDDEIGLLAPSSVSGKPQGADILEDKKTLHRAWLMASLKGGDLDRARGLYGSATLVPEDFEWLLKLHGDHGVLSRVEKTLDDLSSQAHRMIETLPGLLPGGRDLLGSVLRYNRQRTW